MSSKNIQNIRSNKDHNHINNNRKHMATTKHLKGEKTIV